jgi:hypothetical protein
MTRTPADKLAEYCKGFVEFHSYQPHTAIGTDGVREDLGVTMIPQRQRQDSVGCCVSVTEHNGIYQELYI